VPQMAIARAARHLIVSVDTGSTPHLLAASLWLCGMCGICLQAADGSDILLYGADAAAAAGGLMEASYRNLQEARVALQAVYALMTAGVWLGA